MTRPHTDPTPTIPPIERGEKNLQLDTLQRICSGLECKMWEVLKDAETQTPG